MQQGVADIAPADEAQPWNTQDERDHDFVAEHGGQRHRGHDDHAGARRHAADIGGQGYAGGVGRQRQGEHETVGIDLARLEQHQPGSGQRYHEQRHQQQIQREQPACRVQVARIGVFYHAHVELARQAQRGANREDAGGDKACIQQRGVEQLVELVDFAGLGEQVTQTVEHAVDHEQADEQKGRQFDDRLEGDCQDQALMRLARVHVACAEEDGEHRHQHRHIQPGVHPGHMRLGVGVGYLGALREGIERHGQRLELQRDIGQHHEQGDARHQGRQPLRLAIARGDEVGDRRRILLLGDEQHLAQDRRQHQQREHRPDIDGQIGPAPRCCTADVAEERPRGAVNRQ